MYKERDDYVNYICAHLSEARVRHTLGVEKAALGLGIELGIDPIKASTAALLHDIAKEYPKKELLLAAENYGIEASVFEERYPGILHGPVGAKLAEDVFGITDGEVLLAIRYHTTLRDGATLLEQLIFIADSIEEGRKYPSVEEIRTVAKEAFGCALRMALSGKLEYQIKRQKPIHKTAVAAYNWFIEEKY